MRSDDVLDALIELNVLEQSPDGETLTVSDGFDELVDETRSTLERDESFRDALEERFDDPDVVEALARIGEEDLSFVANYCALTERTESLSPDDLVRVTAVLAQIQGSVPRTEGVPDWFLPVRGDQLPTLLQFAPRAIVYVWREECEPCDLMCETFREAFDGDPPDDVALFAVYGPEHSELLYEEFDVSGAPATLFTIGDRVDSRLYGAHYPEAVEGEIEKIRERS